MATKPTHTTMQNTAAIPAARHTDPAGLRRPGPRSRARRPTPDAIPAVVSARPAPKSTGLIDTREFVA